MGVVGGQPGAVQVLVQNLQAGKAVSQDMEVLCRGDSGSPNGSQNGAKFTTDYVGLLCVDNKRELNRAVGVIGWSTGAVHAATNRACRLRRIRIREAVRVE